MGKGKGGVGPAAKCSADGHGQESAYGLRETAAASWWASPWFAHQLASELPEQLNHHDRDVVQSPSCKRELHKRRRRLAAIRAPELSSNL